VRALTSASPEVGIDVAHIVRPIVQVVIGMRQASAFAQGLGSEIEQLRCDLHGQARLATLGVMVLL
jgi:hypothetical protein